MIRRRPIVGWQAVVYSWPTFTVGETKPTIEAARSDLIRLQIELARCPDGGFLPVCRGDVRSVRAPEENAHANL